VWQKPDGKGIELGLHLDSQQLLEIRMYDVTGRAVVSLPAEVYGAGSHQVRIDYEAHTVVPLSSGVYFVLVKGEDWQTLRKVVLVR
jgi:hypothetical protein